MSLELDDNPNPEKELLFTTTGFEVIRLDGPCKVVELLDQYNRYHELIINLDTMDQSVVAKNLPTLKGLVGLPQGFNFDQYNAESID